MLRSLRSRLILASLLWTVGLLFVMHMLSIVLMHAVPRIRTVNGYVFPIVAGIVLMAAGVLLGMRQGLTPFHRLRERLLAVRTGDERRVEGVYPTEVQPLVDDLNALLEDREKAVKRALATAGDLAHGLKTPLALLAQEADRAGAAGNGELAEHIAQHVDRMSRQVTYHLARSRAASGVASGARCPVAPCVDALVRTLLKIYAEHTLTISANVAPDLYARVQREDLDEMLGNLLDNACKWANSQIGLDASRVDGMVVVRLDDDGPGLAGDLRSRVLERGVRADEGAPGSGLGLAIVRDLAELYGGSISLDASPLGGLQARISFPAA
jgi:signal transduction histidine kinase